MVSLGIMATQVNVRMSEDLLGKAKQYAEVNGYENVQDFIRETLREKMHPDELTEKELSLIKRLIKATEEKNLYISEKELFRRLRLA
jgi:hypothetical protein